MSPTLRNEDTFHALVRRLYDAGMLVELDEVRERVGLFTVARPDDFQRLVVLLNLSQKSLCLSVPLFLIHL